MTQEESGLFQVRINEEGKKFIRRFATISYTMMVLVFFESAITIYWNVRMLMVTSPLADEAMFRVSLYDHIVPYLSMTSALMAIVSNFYYLRFPRVLLHCLEVNDEFGTNQAFRLLFRGAFIFLCWLILISSSLIWALVIQARIV